MTCKSPADLLMHDVPDQDRWLEVMQTQPASGWDSTTNYAAWKHVPSIYVGTRQDKLLPQGLQEQFAQTAGSELVWLDTGHMMPLVKPAALADIILKAAA